ncbi:MAG TPA: GAF domain-containing sensor histidine kinase [Solirubrobacterales bacterium]
MSPFHDAEGRSQEDRFARLIEIGSALLSELDLEAVLVAVVDAARELTGAQYAALGVLDRERTELERFIYRGIDDATRREIGSLPRGRGVLGELIREPAPLRLRDVNEHPHAYGFPPNHPPMRSFLGVPIRVRGETFGNLYMTEKAGAEEFDEADEKAALTLATWAGVAIDNARLYTSLAEREAELAQALRRAETSVDIARTVGGETDTERVLDLIVKRARALVDARAVLVLLRRGERLYVAARAGRVEAAVEELTLPVDGSVFGEAMRDRSPRRLEGLRTRAEHGLREAAGVEAALVVPLVFRGRAVGTLVALDREAGGAGFDQEDSRLLAAFASSAATAVGTAQTVQSELLQQQVEIGERERQHWAQELHDETLQGLAAIRISLAAALQSGGEERPGRIEAAAEETVDRLEAEINELSRLINDLRPAALERLGLERAIVEMADENATRHDLEIEAAVDVPVKLSGEEERIVYRLVQEALTNVVKHAGAGRVELAARWSEGELRVAVADDGDGFDPAAVASGHGLRGMRERVQSLGGEIAVESEPGLGTRVTASLPISPSG